MAPMPTVRRSRPLYAKTSPDFPVGQPIRLTQLSGGSNRNPFDSAVMPGRPLSERVSAPGGRSRSLSPDRRYNHDDASRKGIDRYVPGDKGRSRSPAPRRRGGAGGAGRRPGARREPGAGGRDQDSGKGGRGGQRTKKTQEELDDEMADYFGGGGSAAGPAQTEQPASNEPAAPAPAAVPAGDDIDMIE